MYHYTECGLPNVYLKNGFTIEHIDGEDYTSIDDMNNLHVAIAQTIADSHTPLCPAEFKFLRIELNLSQKMPGHRFGVSEQTIATLRKRPVRHPSNDRRCTPISIHGKTGENQLR